MGSALTLKDWPQRWIVMCASWGWNGTMLQWDLANSFLKFPLISAAKNRAVARAFLREQCPEAHAHLFCAASPEQLKAEWNQDKVLFAMTESTRALNVTKYSVLFLIINAVGADILMWTSFLPRVLLWITLPISHQTILWEPLSFSFSHQSQGFL